MPRTVCSKTALAALALSLASGLSAYQDAPVVFKSDVSLVRVDVQVLSATGQVVGKLQREDFELRESGQVREIVNFGRENLPLDLILLIDVSGSMRPHVERIANAAHEALGVLGNEDRVAILVFDRSTRTSMPFNQNHDEIVRGFERLLERENFNGGTDITRAMYDATKFMQRNARAGARRGIVILTDDRTEFNADEFGVGRALEEANTVMSALITPDAMGGMGQRYPGTSRGGGGAGGGYPGGNGGGLGGLGGIIFGGGGIPGTRRTPGGGYPGGGNGPVVIGNGRLKSAGTEEIARASGGDSMNVDNASALTDTLERIRQSYALYFNAPEGVKQGEKRNVQIALTGSATRRYQNAELRYRPSYVVSEGSTTSGPSTSSDDAPTVTRRNPGTSEGVSDRTPARTDDSVQDTIKPRRRVAVDEPGSGTGGFRRVGGAPVPARKAAEAEPVPVKAAEVKPAAVPVKVEATKPKEDGKPGGFRRIKPGEKP